MARPQPQPATQPTAKAASQIKMNSEGAEFMARSFYRGISGK
jgi:hypothetical protein